MLFLWFWFGLFFPFWEMCDLSPINPVGIQYGAICSPAHVPLLPSGNSVFDISRAYTCCCRGVWSNFWFLCRSKRPVEGAVFTERFGVRQSLLWRFKWEFKKESFSLLLGRFITQTAGSVHGIFLHKALQYGFLHVLGFLPLICIHIHLTPPPYDQPEL